MGLGLLALVGAQAAANGSDLETVTPPPVEENR